MEGKFEKFFDNATVFFSKTTNRELYKYRNVLEFCNDSYVLVNPISDANIRGMRENMDDNDQILFDQFLQRNWGISPQTIGATATEAASMQRQQENANAVQQNVAPQPKVNQTMQQNMTQPIQEQPYINQVPPQMGKMPPMGPNPNLGPVTQ